MAKQKTKPNERTYIGEPPYNSDEQTLDRTSFVSTKEKEAGAEANCDPAKKTYSSFQACRISEKPRPCN